MAFNIWKLHCKNVDLTIVIQPNILLLLSLIYCTFSFIPVILSRMFIPLFNTAAAAYGSSLWHKYGNHEQGGHIKFHSKNKYLATHLFRITQHEQQIFSSSYSSDLDHLSIFLNICFLINCCWHRIVNSDTKLLAFTKYRIHSQNTKYCSDYYWSNKKSLSNTDLHLLFYNRSGPRVTKPIQRFTMSVAIEPLCFWEVAKLKTCIITNLQ